MHLDIYLGRGTSDRRRHETLDVNELTDPGTALGASDVYGARQ